MQGHQVLFLNSHIPHFYYEVGLATVLTRLCYCPDQGKLIKSNIILVLKFSQAQSNAVVLNFFNHDSNHSFGNTSLNLNYIY
jgi:hypothetical protein